MQTEGSNPKGCALMLGIVAVMVGVLALVATMQGQGEVDFEDAARPYLDALVQGDWEQASRLDHPDRQETAATLTQAWTDREKRLGDLQSWELWVANPGVDPDGDFVLAKVRLGFEQLAEPMVVRVTVRPAPDGHRIREISAVPGIHIHEQTF